MKTKKLLRNAIAWALMLALCCAAGLMPLAHAWEDPEPRTVRVPCGFSSVLKLDADGTPYGQIADYLDKLAQINNWQYEYVQTNWNEAVDLLERGELDLLFPTNYTDDRAQTMDFSSLVGGYAAPGLFAPSDSDYDYEDFPAFDGARIGVTQGSSNEADLARFAQAKGFTYETVYLNTPEEKSQALKEDRVDMVIFSAANVLADTVLVSVLEPSPFYLTVQKGNDALLQELDHGMRQILKDDSDLVAETYRQCLLGDNSGLLAFTREEKAFIQSGRPVVIGFYEGSTPLAQVDEDNVCSGVYVELLEYVKERSGLNLVYQPVSRDNDWQDLVTAGELDFFVGASSALTTKDYRATDAFFPYDNVLITRNDCVFGELNSPVIALTNGRHYLSGYITQTLGAERFRYYRSAKDCLVAVLNGEADGTVLNNIEYNYHSKNARFADLIQRENYRFTTKGGLIATADVDPTMFSVVNKAIDLLSDDFVDVTISNHLNMAYDHALVDVLYVSRYLLIGLAIALGSAIIVGVIAWRVRKRRKALMAEAQEHESHQLRIQAALSRNYDAVYYANLDENYFDVVQIASQTHQRVAQASKGFHAYSDVIRHYAESFVLPEDQEVLLELGDPQAIIQRFQETPDFSVRYRIKPDETGREFYELHLVDVSEPGKEHAMVLGGRCIDDVVAAERDQRQLLQDALEAANRASSAKSDFLSKMSHDIRTPMNAIIGMTAIAGAHLDDPDRVKDALSKISSSSRYLLGLINEVLDMSKIESGAITLNEDAFNLSDLLNNLLLMIMPQIKQHNHSLEVHIQDIQHEDVLGDNLRIQQAFLNIMGNAVKYTPDGGQLTLTVRELPMRSPKLAGYEFVFQDNGIGMSQEYIQNIFEPFSRAEDVRVSKIQGTGLGMTITQNIVHQMDGSIKVESEEGKGSTFTVTIYLKLQEGRELDASELAQLPVLVVDDDPDACDSVCELLDQIGMKSHGCNSGQEGVEAVKRTMNTPDQFYAAILDWKMPGMDGVATAKAIRKLVGDELPLIILSAYDWSDIEPEARASGVNAFLSKPVFKQGLIRQFKALRNEDEPRPIGDQDQLQDLQDSDYTGSRVLLVEDNELNREIAREILEMAGLEVDDAENGKVAVDKVLESPPGHYRMVFMDIQMPVMSGYDAAMAIRSLGRSDSRSLPIIAMTANAFVEDVQASKAAGMNEHLAKPIDFDRLSAILKKYLA